jgi:hypothetical protein
MRPLVLALFLLAFPGISAAAPLFVTAPACRDNTLFEDADGDTSNGAGPAMFAGRNAQERARRALVEFDLAGVVPAGRHVEDALVILHVSSAPDTVARTFRLHRVLRAWGEGASNSSGGAGAPALPGDATWRSAFHPDIAWDAVGGDFVLPASGEASCGDVGPCSFSSPGILEDVRTWLANPVTNHGWIVLGDETLGRTVRRFDTRESALPADRPVLVLSLSEADPDPVPATVVSWGRLKTSYR